MARHGVNYASPCRLDRLYVTKTAQLSTPYCGTLQEENSCQCEACFSLQTIIIAQSEASIVNSIHMYTNIK